MKLLVALQMRFKISRDQALSAAEAWLEKHPQNSWGDLNGLVNTGSITYRNQQLFTSNEANQTVTKPINPTSQDQSSRSKPVQRMYRGRPI